uniref:ribonuclease H n=1 Tax=Sparus aurata TaxID=8175 RepID=A0A671UAW8_SPAAU
MKSFQITCWNIQGLRSSAFGLKSQNPDFIREVKDSDITVLQETWYRGDSSTGCPYGFVEIIIPSIKLQTVTQGRDSGGMIIWYRSELTHSIEIIKKVESHIWLKISKEIICADQHVYLCAIYIPPSESPYYNEDIFSTLEGEINQFKTLGNVLICGDLNARTGEKADTINIQGDQHSGLPGETCFPLPELPPRHNFDKITNTSGTQLLQLCRTLGLYIVNGRLRGDSLGRYTFSSALGSSTVDYAITDLDPMSLRAFTVYPLTPLSDHSKITVYLKREHSNYEASKPSELYNTTHSYRWKSDSMESYQKAFENSKIQYSIDLFLSEIFPHNNDGVNTAVGKINAIFDKLANLSNLKTSNHKPKQTHNNKWFDSDCKNIRKTLRKLSNEKHRDPNNQNIRLRYHDTLKQYKHTLRAKKDKHSRTQLSEIEESLESNQFWQKWNTLNKTQQDQLAIQNGSIWMNYFTELYSNFAKNSDQNKTHAKWKTLELAIKDNQNPLDASITEQELTESIQSLKAKKACGVDSILNEMIKYSDHKLKLAILKLFNIILAVGTFPDIWNKGLITPLYKNGDKYDPNNYRGICVNSNLGKTFCNIINKRLISFINDQNVLNKCQIGFLPNFRTTDHIYTLHSLTEQELDKKKGKAYACFVDFTKAFDSIWHEGLFYRLLNSGIGGKTYDVIKSMYTNSKCAVKIGDKQTAFFPQGRGVRQGCNLSPILFNLYINEFACQLDQSTSPGLNLNGTEVKGLLYADDLVLLSPTKEGLQQHLNLLHTFCQSWALTVNPKKTKIMIFQKQSRSQDNTHNFYLDTTKLQHTKTTHTLAST